MFSPIICALSLVLGMLGIQSVQPSLGQDTQVKVDDGVVRIKTELVSLPVSVRDRNGRYVFDLHQQDFILYENGIEQKVEHFSTFEQPVSVVLLLDTSGSTELLLKGIKDSAIAFLNQLGPQDQVYPMVFDNQITPLVTTWTSDRAVLLQAIEQIRTGSNVIKVRPPNAIAGKNVVYHINTRLYEAVKTGLDEIEKIKGRKAIIVFSDGMDNASRRASDRSTLKMVEESDALVYAIHFSIQGRNVAPDDPVGAFGDGKPYWAKRYMENLGLKSGGRYYRVENNDQIQKTFISIAEELRHQYSIGYYPTSPESRKQRKIVIKVTRNDLVVNARNTYTLKVPEKREK